MEQPSLNRDIHAKILNHVQNQNLDKSELANLLAYVTKTYIVDRTIPFNLPLPETDETTEEELQEPALDFPRLIGQLKERTDIPELRYFTIEEGRVILRVDNQKVTFGDKVTFEFVPVKSPPPSKPAAAPTPSSGSSPKKETSRSKPESEQDLSEVEKEALNDIMQRFKRLDLD